MQVQDLKLIDGFTDKIVTTFLKVSSVSRLQSLDSQFVNFIYEEMLNKNRVNPLPPKSAIWHTKS